MSDDAPSTAQVRAYLDQAVVDAADRWVGRSLDATAYADLVAAVLARREALGSTELTRPMSDAPRRYDDGGAAGDGSGGIDQHSNSGVNVSDLRGRHGGPSATPSFAPSAALGSWPAVRVEAIGAGAYGPTSYDLIHTNHVEELPVRPPGRHRSPPAPTEPAPAPIDLSEDLSSVLSWLGRPES
jgi:hypothetical protein